MGLSLNHNLLTELEHNVLQQLVSGDELDVKHLQHQLQCSTIKSREYTEVGFTTYFNLPASVPLVSENFDETRATLFSEHPKTLAGAEFLLQIENGRVISLSGYVLVGEWPADERKFSIMGSASSTELKAQAN